MSIVVAPANVVDGQLLEETLLTMVVDRPKLKDGEVENLCLDKAYDSAPAEAVVRMLGYKPHIRRIGEEKLDPEGQKRHPARRWVVERTLGWLNKCRAIVIRYDKKSQNCYG